MKRIWQRGPSTTLRTGFTTGACAAAAAKGAALMLAHQTLVHEVTLDLPAGISAIFLLQGQEFTSDAASCHVIKDAGDDPDVTNGAEVHARVAFTPIPLAGEEWGASEAAVGNTKEICNLPPVLTLPRQRRDILITGGPGIGRVTKPGLAVSPGEWAINPVPRRMIEEAAQGVLPHQQLHVEISIPDGEVRAKKTLNTRLGIIGGLSILGTTGIVRPISTKAWTDTIDAALDVARACGSPTVILSTGRTSELAAQRYQGLLLTLTRGDMVEGEVATKGKLDSIPSQTAPRQARRDLSLPEEAFIMMGDHVAYTLRSCSERGFLRPIIACQFAKLLKIACGHENTHAAASELDLSMLLRWATAEQVAIDIINVIGKANTAREIILACNFDRTVLEVVSRQSQAIANHFAPLLQTEFLVADYSGKIVLYTPAEAP